MGEAVRPCNGDSTYHDAAGHGSLRRQKVGEFGGLLDRPATERLGCKSMEKTILLVEDSEDDIILMKFALEEAGIRNPVHAVETVNRAIEYLCGHAEFSDRSTYPLPQVLFVDLLLPGKSGHDLLQWMQAREEFGDIVRAVLTGSADPADMRRAYELGANCYFQKPLTADQLTGPARNIRMLLAGPALVPAGH